MDGDSTPTSPTTSANPRKAVNEPHQEGVSVYLNELNSAVEADRKLHEKKSLSAERKDPVVKNMKVNTTDLESGFIHWGSKLKGFFFHDHRTVDDKHSIIMDTHVTPGNVHDSQPFIGHLERQVQCLGLASVTVGMGAGYFTLSVCHQVSARDIALVPGYRRPHKDQSIFQKKHVHIAIATFG